MGTLVRIVVVRASVPATSQTFLVTLFRTSFPPCPVLQPSNASKTVSMPDDVEAELYQHVIWMCEHGYPVSWDSVKAVAWQLGKICRMQGGARPAASELGGIAFVHQCTRCTVPSLSCATVGGRSR